MQIYFYIYPIHPSIKKSTTISKDSVEKFKNYLETRGSSLSKTNEFLQYYALPYIPKPHEHQALKHLFTSEWVQDVHERLVEFINILYSNEETPILVDIYQKYVNNNLSGGN